MARREDSVEARTQEPFEIKLSSVGSAGYMWSVASLPVGVEQLGRTTRPIDRGVAGGPIEQIFAFRASKPGTYTISFELKRPWLAEIEDSRTVNVTVSQ